MFLYARGKIRYDKKVSEGRTVLKETFGENVRYYRKKKKLTLESAAELCDISSRYLGRIERAGKREEGKPSVSIDIIEKISKGLEIPVEKLLAVRGYEKDSFHADKKETAPLRKERQEKK